MKLTIGINIYQFTDELLYFCFQTDVVVVSNLSKNFGGLTDLAKKAWISMPLLTNQSTYFLRTVFQIGMLYQEMITFLLSSF